MKNIGLKLNIQKTKITSSSRITSWQIDGERVETVADFTFFGSKITSDRNCCHKVMTNLDSILKSRDITLSTKVDLVKAMDFPGKSTGVGCHCLLPMTNLDSILKSRDITLSTKVRLVKAMVFPVVMYGCESWTVKKAEC